MVAGGSQQEFQSSLGYIPRTHAKRRKKRKKRKGRKGRGRQGMEEVGDGRGGSDLISGWTLRDQ